MDELAKLMDEEATESDIDRAVEIIRYAQRQGMEQVPRTRNGEQYYPTLHGITREVIDTRVATTRATVEACIALLMEDYDNALLASYQSGIGLCIANLRRQLPPPEATDAER